MKKVTLALIVTSLLTGSVFASNYMHNEEMMNQQNMMNNEQMTNHQETMHDNKIMNHQEMIHDNDEK